MVNFRKMLNDELLKNGLICQVNCTKEENEKFGQMKPKDLPANVVRKGYATENEFFKYTTGNLTQEEIKLFLLAKQNSNLRVIKGCIIFFVVLAVIGIIVGCVLGGQISSALNSYSSYRVSPSLY